MTESLRDAPVLTETFRSGAVEIVHRGCICVVDTSGEIVAAHGSPEVDVYWRSAAKLHQALALLLAPGFDRAALTADEISVLCSSHHGTARQTACVESVLRKFNCSPSALRCDPQAPKDFATAASLFCEIKSPTALHHQCSGNHAGFIALNQLLGAQTDDYTRLENIAQQRALEVVAQFTGIARDAIGIGGDGCGIPSYRTPLRSLATAFARLISPPINWPANERTRCAEITRSLAQFPDLISGSGEIDAETLRAFGGHALCKTGADGVLAAAFGASEKFPRGLGLAIKLADGPHPRARDVAFVTALDQLEIGTPAQRDQLRAHVDSAVRSGPEKIVGQIEPRFNLRGISA